MEGKKKKKNTKKPNKPPQQNCFSYFNCIVEKSRRMTNHLMNILYKKLEKRQRSIKLSVYYIYNFKVLIQNSWNQYYRKHRYLHGHVFSCTPVIGQLKRILKPSQSLQFPFLLHFHSQGNSILPPQSIITLNRHWIKGNIISPNVRRKKFFPQIK